MAKARDNLRGLSSESDENLLVLLRDRYRITEQGPTKRQRERELDDRRFITGDQWPRAVKAQRDADELPSLVFNRLQGNVARVANEVMLDPPHARVKPADSVADVETAKVINGILRHAQIRSHSDDALRSGVQGGVISGRGYYRLYIKMNNRTLHDELWWQRIRNPMMVRPDPHAQEIDLSDMRYCFLVRRMGIREFHTLYPGYEAAMQGWAQEDEDDWITKDTVRVVEYYFTEAAKVSRTRLADGRVYDTENIPGGASRRGSKTVEVDVLKTWHVHSNGYDVMAKAEFPSEFIPVIPIFGDEIEVDGDTHYIGVTRNGKDPQRYYNYNKSKIAETVSLAPKAPYVMAEGQEVGHEAMWNTANTTRHPYLLYKPTSYEGQPTPPPQRQVFEPPVQALVQEAVFAADDIQHTSRVHDAAKGAQTNETSGVAIAQRTQGSEISNSHFQRNMLRSTEHACRIALDVIRSIYTAPEVVRIINDDETEDVVQINQRFMENGQEKLYDLTVGEYDVVVSTGPGYKTQREEAVNTLVELTRAYPAVFQYIGHLILGNMDIPFAQEAAEIFKRTIPPELLDTANMPPEEVLQTQLAQAIQAIQAMNALAEENEQQIATLQTALQQTQQQLNDKTRDLDRKDAELSLRARIETGKLEDQRRQTGIKEDAQELDEDQFALDVAKESQNGTA